MEACNGYDDDCDGITDEDGAIDSVTWYADLDGDGHGDPASSVLACEAPTGWIPDGTDCDDEDGGIHPEADEACNGHDDDCDGITDEDEAFDVVTWYADADADGWGDGTVVEMGCDHPAGYVTAPGDCDDGNASVYPGATEYCDGQDDDCDGMTDEDGAIDAVTWYYDADGDAWGDPADTVVDCERLSGYVAAGGDCDEEDATIHPGAAETCDGRDEDCDSMVDEDAVDATTWYRDADGDATGDPSAAVVACDGPDGYVATGGDCDDTDDATRPGAAEICNGLDDDCDGVADEDLSTWYQDADGDAWGDATAVTTDCACPDGYVATSGDCDDGDATVHPSADERCDGVDDDCDGDTDEDDAIDVWIWYRDRDGDGRGDASVPEVDCDGPVGYVLDATDCDDDDASAYLGAAEVCDGADNDCDGTVDEDDAMDVGGDCDETDPYTFPNAAGWDSTGLCMTDVDDDGYGDVSPADGVSPGTDCDDANAAVHPKATDTCNGIDDDCDGIEDVHSSLGSEVSVSIGSGDVTLSVVQDVYVSKAAPTTNYTGDKSLYVGGTAYVPDPSYRALFEFDLRDVPEGFTQARLLLYMYGQNGYLDDSFDIYDLAGGWDEDTVTWSTQPSTVGSLYACVDASVLQARSSNWYAWDVTQWVDAKLADPTLEQGLVMMNDLSYGYPYFCSDDTLGVTCLDALRPVLVITP